MKVVGVDLSLGMIETARGRAPEVDFRVGDMRSLDLGDASAAGGVAFYSLIHFSPAELGRALGEIARVLQPGAPLLVAVHRGSQTVHLDELEAGCAHRAAKRLRLEEDEVEPNGDGP